MFESIGRSIMLVKTSWHILMQDKKLLAFPIISGVLSLIVLATFIIPLIVVDFIHTAMPGGDLFFYGVLFAFYLASYFVVIFFNTALISCVNARLQGYEMSVGDGIANAFRHFWSILAWALVSATVGVILYLIRERAGFMGNIVASFIGGAWGLVTFFVIPILVLEDKGVADSFRESASLIRKTWGESIVGSGSMMIIFAIIGVIGLLVVFATHFLGNLLIFGIAAVLFVFLIIILAVVGSAMQGIFVVALYTYAKTGTVPSAFDRDLIANAFMPKTGQAKGNI